MLRRLRSRRTLVVAALGALLFVVGTAGIGSAQDDGLSAKRVEVAASKKSVDLESARAPRWWPTTTRRATTTTTRATTTTTRATTTTTRATTTTTRPPTTTTTTTTTRPPTGGRTYHVAPTGNDGAAGSVDAPWRSLSGSILRLEAGDTLLVRGGTYNAAMDERFNIENKNGSAGAWTTIAAYPGEKPVVKLNSFWQGFYVFNSSYVEIRGLEIVGTALTDQRMTDGIEIKKSHHVKVVGNIVHDTGGCGICTIEANHVRIEGNEVYGTSKWNTYQTSAISFFLSANIGGGDNSDGYSMYISGNRVHHNTNIAPPGAGQKVTDGNCIIIDYNDDNGYTGSSLVQNNLCYENGGRGVHVFHAKNVLAINNTLVNNLRHADIDGGELTASSATALVYRNNLTLPSRPGKGVVVWSAQVQLDHNVYVGQAPAQVGTGDKVTSIGVNADYTPATNSPAINGGNPAGAPATDIRGVTRDAQPDIGAFEKT